MTHDALIAAQERAIAHFRRSIATLIAHNGPSLFIGDAKRRIAMAEMAVSAIRADATPCCDAGATG